MWPFKKPDNRPRVMVVDAWRGDGAVDLNIRRVTRIGNYFTMSKYDFTNEAHEVFVLQPGGTFRGKPNMTWEMIDPIDGLTNKPYATKPPALPTDEVGAVAEPEGRSA